jgi:hypothetical protein
MTILFGALAHGVPAVFFAALAVGLLHGIADAIREKPRQ